MRAGTRLQAYELVVSQWIQMPLVTPRMGGKQDKLEEGKLQGDRITLEFTSKIDGDALPRRLAGRVAGQSIA